jgi:hypothetical protein
MESSPKNSTILHIMSLLKDYRLIKERRFVCPNDLESFAGRSKR